MKFQFFIVISTFILLNIFYKNDVLGEKVLIFYPALTKSHVILGHALARGLAENGHEITMFSPYPMTSPPKNFTEVLIKELNAKMYWNNSDVSEAKFELNNDYFFFVSKFGLLGPLTTEHVLEEPEVKLLLNSNTKFDAIVVPVLFNEALFALGHQLRSPVIALSTVGLSWMTDYLVGNPNHPAYMPLTAQATQIPMTFFERFINTFISLYFHIWRTYIYLPRQEIIKNKYFPNAPKLTTILKNTSLVLLNSHHTISYPKPLVPNMVEIGGFHIQPPKNLSNELETFLNEAKEGVIYFSMGSNLNSANLPDEKQEAFFEAFSKLEQRVLWKWESNKKGRKLPTNLKLMNWLPQQDILNHPNLKIFISHAGLLSFLEATHFGVPIIGIPIYADQHMNINSIVLRGYGLRLDYDNLTSESILWTINEILHNEKYFLNAKKQSQIFRDQPLKPMEKAVYSVEHVMRHKGTLHLRSGILDLSYFQLLLLDIIGSILLVVVFVTVSVYLIIRKLKQNHKFKQH